MSAICCTEVSRVQTWVKSRIEALYGLAQDGRDQGLGEFSRPGQASRAQLFPAIVGQHLDVVRNLFGDGHDLLDRRGDGSLGFYLAEMDSLVRHKLPVVLIVGNDAGWGLERELQSLVTEGRAPVACELSPARYDMVMQAFGGAGETIERLEQVRPAIERAFSAGVPYCLNVKIRGVRSPFTEWQIAGKGAPSRTP